MRACWLKWVGRDWSISADYIWLNYSDANSVDEPLEETNAIAERALQEVDTASEENIRVLKNKARSWFAGYIASEKSKRSEELKPA